MYAVFFVIGLYLAYRAHWANALTTMMLATGFGFMSYRFARSTRETELDEWLVLFVDLMGLAVFLLLLAVFYESIVALGVVDYVGTIVCTMAAIGTGRLLATDHQRRQ